MKYYLQSIADLLLANNFTKVFYDYDQPASPERIFIANAGGQTVEPNQAVGNKDFSIYIRRNNREQARVVANNVFLLLSGNNVAMSGILKMSVQSPLLFSVDVNANLASEFLISGSCLCLDNDLNRIF